MRLHNIDYCQRDLQSTISRCDNVTNFSYLQNQSHLNVACIEGDVIMHQHLVLVYIPQIRHVRPRDCSLHHRVSGQREGLCPLVFCCQGNQLCQHDVVTVSSQWRFWGNTINSFSRMVDIILLDHEAILTFDRTNRIMY